MLTAMSESRGQPMTVVFSCVPQAGHLTPLLPLATELAAQGDRVIVASAPGIADAVTKNGLGFHDVCPDLGEWFGVLAARTYGQPGDGLPPERVEPYFIPRLFAEVGLAAMVDGLSDLLRDVRPDLVIYEPYALAAPLAAAQHGIEAVQHTIGLRFDPLVLDLVTDAVTPAWRAAGLGTPSRAGLYDGLTLDICPPSLDPFIEPAPGEKQDELQPMRPTPLPDPSATLPIELPHPDRPLVYVTLGTFSNSDLSLFALILRALADLPVTVLATIGTDNDPAVLGDVPDNAVVMRFVPQAAVLPHCAAVVHHAGAGTMFGVLAHGLPSVALPQSADNFRLADRLAATGAAQRVMPEELNEAAVRDAVRGVLAEPSYRHHAEQMAGEIAAMPAPADVAAMLRRRSAIPRPPVS
jgi:UDP-N-acetylglucosamine:LPS N-acetylglucosamine transferase